MLKPADFAFSAQPLFSGRSPSLFIVAFRRFTVCNEFFPLPCSLGSTKARGLKG